MSRMDKISETVAERSMARGQVRPPRVLAFGHSHSQALQRAVVRRQRKGQPVPVSVYRQLKEKNGTQIGDTLFEEFLARIHDLNADDFVISMIGGNQHAVLSTIQHPRPFDFFMPSAPAREPPEGVELIPYRALADLFATLLRNGDGAVLKAIREATRARVIHVVPPPPKADNAFIEKNHETLFASKGIANSGASSPELRLNFWKLQTRMLTRLCKKLEIELLLPPRVTVADGFLRPNYYANDATHANWRYGEQLIREIERRYLGGGSSAPAQA
jgi:hypothetical protein